MDHKKLLSFFIKEESIFSPYIDLYFYCKEKRARFEQLWALQDERFREFLDLVGSWFDLLNEREMLKAHDIAEMEQLLSEKVETIDDSIVFAYAFLQAVESRYDFLTQQTRSSRGNYVLFQNERGTVVVKNTPFPKLFSKSKSCSLGKMRLRHQFWPTDFESHFQFFHVLPKEWEGRPVTLNSIPEFLQAQWENDLYFKIGLSQLAIDPEFQSALPEDSGREVLFNIVNDKSGRQLFDRICNEMEEAFKLDISVMVFPELLLMTEFEDELLQFLQDMSMKYRRFIMVIIGYLHVLTDEKYYVNEAKCFVPELDPLHSKVTYQVLCVERKKKAVNFLANEPGLEVISDQATGRGAIENIYPGESWSILETPLGRMGFVICKDFLAIQETMLQALEIDFLYVSAMTKSMTGKFVDRARNFANMTLTGTAVANNGWFVETSKHASKNYSMGVAPLFVSKGQPYIEMYDRDTNNTSHFKVFTL